MPVRDFNPSRQPVRRTIIRKIATFALIWGIINVTIALSTGALLSYYGNPLSGGLFRIHVVVKQLAVSLENLNARP